MSPIRILVVEDYAAWRRHVRLLLQVRSEFQVVCEVADGLEAVQKAQELKPDLILLDIGLPRMNGIDAARQIRKLVPESKILFISQESDADVVQETLALGISGYVAKVEAGRELLTAVEAVLRGDRFVSSGLAASVRERVRNNTHFQLEFDPENKIVRAKFQGPVTAESIKEFYRAAAVAFLVADTDFRGSIADFSCATWSNLTPDILRELAALPAIDPTVSRPRVIVAPNAIIFGLARVFQLMAKKTRPNLHVVRNLQDALVVLGAATPSFQSTE